MPKSEIAVVLDSLGANQRYVDGWVAAANASGVSVEEFVLDYLKMQGKNFAHNYHIGTFPTSAFILRVRPQEYDKIVEAAQSDPNVAGLLAELSKEPHAAIDDPRLGPGLDYLIAIGLIAPERKAELLAYERPEPI